MIEAIFLTIWSWIVGISEYATRLYLEGHPLAAITVAAATLFVCVAVVKLVLAVGLSVILLGVIGMVILTAVFEASGIRESSQWKDYQNSTLRSVRNFDSEEYTLRSASAMSSRKELEALIKDHREFYQDVCVKQHRRFDSTCERMHLTESKLVTLLNSRKD